MRTNIMKKEKTVDPLYVIFEKHLYDFSYEEVEAFISDVVDEYVSYLNSNKDVMMNMKHKIDLMEDLMQEVHEMLLKKIYGCFSIKEYINSGKITDIAKVRAHKNYTELMKSK